MNKLAKSPLRYPGGKSKVVDQILALVPAHITEFREPFIGGGSVFLAVRSLFQSNIRRYWMNDLNYDLYCFWVCVRDCLPDLVQAVSDLRDAAPDGRALYNGLKDETQPRSDFERAVRFFVMNRITFSGVMDAGGYSQKAFETRFTASSIQRLAHLGRYLAQTKITHGDYEVLLRQAGAGVFLFLDPPYLSATESRLYGVRGRLHTSFDHERFAAAMQQCPHRWLITYDDSPEVRKLFAFATIIEWEVQYGMNNYKQPTAAKGSELFIKNY